MFGLQRPHLPTLGTTLLLLLAGFLIYHFVFARKGS